MSWNDPDDKNRDPWGGTGGNQGPPDLDALFRKLTDRLKRLFGGKPSMPSGGGSSGYALMALVVILVTVWLLSGVYIIDKGWRGVALRFGKHVETTLPGPHWHWPYPVGSVRRVNVEQEHTVTVGYESVNDVRANPVPKEALMLTKDDNVANVELSVQYHIEDPASFLFNVKNPDYTLKQAAESALSQQIGTYSLSDLLSGSSADRIESATEQAVRASMKDYGTGLMVDSVTLRNVQRPAPVKKAAADVAQAGQDVQQLLEKANAYKSKTLEQARQESARIKQDAQDYKLRSIARARGDIQRFNELLPLYRKNPELTRQWYYRNTMEQILEHTSNVLVDLKPGQAAIYLPLDKLLKRAPGETPASGGTSAKQPSAKSGASGNAPPPENKKGGSDALQSREAR